MDLKMRDELAVRFGQIVSEAGRIIMAVQAAQLGVGRKADGSPVCRADLDAERHILARLATVMPGVAVIAEESFTPDDSGPAPERFLLVDPLDGTREFLAGHSDFTVNIALIEAGVPIVGAICAPALAQAYLAGATALRADLEAGALPATDAMHVIHTGPVPATGPRALVSRSHLNPPTEHWLAERNVTQLRPAGSSLKFCLIARGEADVYPRIAPTMEWDTAAGHAILNAAGGCVFGLDGSPLRYGKRDAGFKNEGFVAWGRKPAR
jgi:3'(2'), 5'-bisphosphate nucleotidase